MARRSLEERTGGRVLGAERLGSEQRAVGANYVREDVREEDLGA